MSQALWEKIANSIRQDIETGRLQIGDKLETEAQLTERWGVSAMTVHRAMQELHRQGWVIRQQGRGTTVAKREKVSTGDVALIFPNWSNMFEFEYMRGVTLGLGDEYRIVFFTDYSDVNREAQLLQSVVGETDGMIYLPMCYEENLAAMKHIVESGFPMVCLDRVPKGVEVDAVISDNFGNSVTALQTLVEKGHRKIAHFTEPDLLVSSVRERYEAFLQVMRESGEAQPEEYVRMFPFVHQSFDSVVALVQDSLFSLTHRADPVTAVFCLNDSCLAAVLAAAENLKLTIPHDVEILAFNEGITLTPMVEKRLNRIAQQPFEMGRQAAELLKRRIKGENSEKQHIFVPADFYPAQPTAS